MYQKYVKRILDIVLSLLALIVLSPILLIICMLVKIDMGSPIFFKQDRPGKYTRIFTLYKFRTMNNNKDYTGKLLPDTNRITKLGDFLRNTSLDEFPELFNILKGDMSIVGPRPLLIKYLDFYTPKENVRHSVRPGLTGLAQISGRNSATWSDKFDKDIEYVNNVSFIFDVKIILKTFSKVLSKEGVIIREDNPMLDLDVERESQQIKIKELDLKSIIKYQVVLRTYIKNLLINANLDEYSDINYLNKSVNKVYRNMIKFKKNNTAFLEGAFNTVDDLVGFIWAYKKDFRFHINYFYISKIYRSKGIGTKLLSAIYDKAKLNNIFCIELVVFSSNANALNFYSKQGFVTERLHMLKKI